MFHRSWGIMLIQANISGACAVLDFATREYPGKMTPRRFGIRRSVPGCARAWCAPLCPTQGRDRSHDYFLRQLLDGMQLLHNLGLLRRQAQVCSFVESGDELFERMRQMENELKVHSFFLMDENFLLRRERAMRVRDRFAHQIHRLSGVYGSALRAMERWSDGDRQFRKVDGKVSQRIRALIVAALRGSNVCYEHPRNPLPEGTDFAAQPE